MSSVKCDSEVMFGFVISLVVLFGGVVVITSAQNCSQSRDFCADYVEIKYPFWYDDYEYSNGSDYQHCGYPGFGIKCVENKTITVMNISNQLYRPSNIHHEGKYLIVKEIDIDQQQCPHPKRNFSLQQFQSAVSYQYINTYSWTFYYNCSTPPNDIEKFHVRCLDNSGLRSYAFPNQSLVPKGFNVSGNCDKPLLAPPSINRYNNYTTDAKQGFLLRWSTPRGDCEKCESSGGWCIYNSKGNFRNCSCGSNFSKEFDKICHRQEIGQLMGLAPGVSPSHQPTVKSNQHRQRGFGHAITDFLVAVVWSFIACYWTFI